MNKYEAKFLNLNFIAIETKNKELKAEDVSLFCDDEAIEYSNFCLLEESEEKITYRIHVQSFKFGGEYTLIIDNKMIYINVLPIMDLPLIDDLFYYDGEDLGFTYSKKETTFKLWSPLASKATVKIWGRKEEEFEMVREDKGVFSYTFKGNLDGVKYLYSTTINGHKKYAIDPYGRASTPNSQESVVIDFTKTYKFKAPELPILEKYTDAIIYETSIRDMTSYEHTNIEHKGQYLGMIEPNKKSDDGVDVGLAHLLRLGITHVQVLPSYDFGTIDELNPKEKYNWGYDPVQYNVPEGSFCSNVKDPYCRINEYKQMVDGLHEAGLKINMDVVYNHMYEHKERAFEILTPNYYFRHKLNGELSNGSYCGNDFASERRMVSKYIVDSTKYWVKEYNIDGFRFDLMGIIDIKTCLKIVEECSKIKPGLMFYGEGWNMPTFLSDEQKAMHDNAAKLLPYGFFNDVFRDINKGSSFDDKYQQGYLTGEVSYVEGFKYTFMGSVVHYVYQPKFVNANQSLNYVECHDNETLYDKVDLIFRGDTPRQKQKRVCLMNQLVILSYGFPFIHMGQEVGLSKFGESNTYNMGDRFNQYNYSILADRKWMVKSLKDAIKIRKQFAFMRLSNPDEIRNMIEFENIDNGGIIINYINKEAIAPYKEFKVIVNPSTKTTYYDLKDYYQVIFNEAGILKDEMFSQSLMINPLTIVIVAKK